VVEEILDSQRPGCPIEYFNIPVPPDHPFRQGEESLEMPFDGKDYTFNYILVSWLLFGDYPVQSTNNWIL
jgi:hypothetical protein